MLIWFKGYNYDLVSGNVNSVSYNKGKRDEFRHRYFYDADNRLTLAETSTDGWNYTLDAKYFYYLHGPLARTELGDYNQKVQVLDYAYTLHGWLKSVNGASLNHERDMGKDGHYTLPNNANAKFGRDAFGFMLHYYDGDYTPVGGLSSNFVPNFAGSNILSFKNDLFNGNIPFMQTSLPDVNAYNTNGAVVNSSLGNLYQYDQLNRLVEHRVFDNFNITTNNWLNTPLNNGTDKFYENFTYDANGNILNINRNGANTGAGLAMDNFTYRYNNNVSQVIYPSSSSTGYCTYPMQSNKLYHVNDAVAASNYTDDVDDQGSFTLTQNTINTANNYGYDEIGNLVRDNAENIQEITWNVYGKIESISRTGNNNKPNLAFTYDAAGQRISKTVMPRNNGVLSTEKDWTTTYYVRDATGNVMATYSQTYTDLQPNQIKEEIKLKELHLYGSSRLGIVNANIVMATQDYYIPSYNTSNGTFVNPSVMFNTLVTTEVSPLPTIFTVYKGNKQYELSNHLGNVLATISDRRVPRDDNGDLLIDYFNADILSTSDYYAFGSGIKERAIGLYRYGFNGEEKMEELAGEGMSYDLGARFYDARLGKMFSIDPLASNYPWQSVYAYCYNNPIWIVDVKGMGGPYNLLGRNPMVQHQISRNGGENGAMVRTVYDMSYSPVNKTVPDTRVTKIAKGTVNILVGAGGAVGSVAYSVGTSGIGAAAGGGIAFTMSMGQFSMGVAQLLEAFTSNSAKNEIIHKYSTPVGLTTYGVTKNENFSNFVETSFSLASGRFSGGNINKVMSNLYNIGNRENLISNSYSAFDISSNYHNLYSILKQEFTLGQNNQNFSFQLKSLTVNTQIANLNLRSSPNSGNNVIGSLPKGSTIADMGLSKDGFRSVMTSDGKFGWVSEDYIK